MKKLLSHFSLYGKISVFLYMAALASCTKPTKENSIRPDADTEHVLDSGLPPKDFSYPSTAYDLTDALPEGYVTDGTVEYTSYLQAGIDAHSVVVFPDFPVMINTPGLRVRSYKEIYFREHSQLKMKGTESDMYFMFSLYDAENVLFKNVNLEGDRNRHLSTTGQWGMGFYLSGCKNITIDHATITNCWGDGIYMGQDSWNQASENVLIRHALVDSCRRSGISIVSGNGVTIENSIIKNTNGPLHSSGITIEPNHNRNDINDIVIKNCLTDGFQKVGIRIVLSNLYENPLSKVSNIYIENHKDRLAYNSIAFTLGAPTVSGGISEGNIHVKKFISEEFRGHAMSDFTNKSSPVAYSVYFKNIIPVKDSKLNDTENNYINNLINNTSYFHWLP